MTIDFNTTLPHNFPINNIESWFFYNLDVTKLPTWYTEEYEHESILRRIAQILVRQGRFNEYTRQQINLLWLEVDSLHQYVLDLELRLDTKDAELLALIVALQHDVAALDERVDLLEESEILQGSLFDFLTQGSPGQIIVKDPAADNWFHSDWKDNDATGVVESIVAGDNITVDNTDPANPIISSSDSTVITSETSSSNSQPSLVTTEPTPDNFLLELNSGTAGLLPVIVAGDSGKVATVTNDASGTESISWQPVSGGGSVDFITGRTPLNTVSDLSIDNSSVPNVLNLRGIVSQIPAVITTADSLKTLKANVVSGVSTLSWEDETLGDMHFLESYIPGDIVNKGAVVKVNGRAYVAVVDNSTSPVSNGGLVSTLETAPVNEWREYNTKNSRGDVVTLTNNGSPADFGLSVGEVVKVVGEEFNVEYNYSMPSQLPNRPRTVVGLIINGLNNLNGASDQFPPVQTGDLFYGWIYNNFIGCSIYQGLAGEPPTTVVTSMNQSAGTGIASNAILTPDEFTFTTVKLKYTKVSTTEVNVAIYDSANALIVSTTFTVGGNTDLKTVRPFFGATGHSNSGDLASSVVKIKGAAKFTGVGATQFVSPESNSSNWQELGHYSA